MDSQPISFPRFSSLRFVMILAAALTGLFAPALSQAQTGSFHDAPASTAATQNPYDGNQNIQAGQKLFMQNCAACHGQNAEGAGNIPALDHGRVQQAKPGQVFWYITHGDASNGMPSWASLSDKQRWQIISYIRALSTPAGPALQAAASFAPVAPSGPFNAPPPHPPFTDFRYEKPGNTHHITVADLPKPFATGSAGNDARIVPRPANVWPQAPKGFKVELYATGLAGPRLIRTAPNGDLFVADSDKGQVEVFRGVNAYGQPQQTAVFATGLQNPFGINFYPLGPNPQWVYIGNTNSVVRFPYQNGDMKARGPSQHIADLAGIVQDHITRDIQFSLDGKTMFVSVGSGSNLDDPDTHPDERQRARIFAFNPDGSNRRVYATGIRNPVGLAINPQTGELWVSVNERDTLGDNLVPDYITHVQEGGFYGWPYFYSGPHPDPRLQGKHLELRSKVIIPDVLLQPHNASLQMMFYTGTQFPEEYRGDIFASEHGSWNRATRAGYEVIRVPLHHTGHADGSYEDFLTGFVLPDGNAWGRPVGVTTAKDGSIFVTDDGSNSIWHIIYTGK